MSESPSSRNFDFNEHFARHETAFRAYARSLLPTWDAVDDVIQSASLVMWRKLDQVDLPNGFLPWGKCVVRFEAQKYCRTKARDHHVFDPDLLNILAEHQEKEEEPDLKRERAALKSCLESMGEASRQLVLAPYQGHGFLTKLAEAGGRTRNSLYKQIRRLRHKLQQCVERKTGGLLPEA